MASICPEHGVERVRIKGHIRCPVHHRDTQRRAAIRYRQSDKGRAANRRYDRSERGRATKQRLYVSMSFEKYHEMLINNRRRLALKRLEQAVGASD